MIVGTVQWWLVEYDQQIYRRGLGRTSCRVVADDEQHALANAKRLVGEHTGFWENARVVAIEGPDALTPLRCDRSIETNKED
jgi:hypothetical protein